MGKDYRYYGQDKHKKKKRKLNKFRLFLFCIVIMLFCSGVYWAGSTVYGFLFNLQNDNYNKFNSFQTVQQSQQLKQETNSFNIGDAAPKPSVSIYDGLYGEAKYLIHIHKKGFQLDLFEKGKQDPIRTYGIAVAKYDGDKQRTGDNRTPTSWGNVVAIPSSYKGAVVGVSSSKIPFRVEEIVDASSWSHDFGDGKGVIEKAYGPWFISLDTGWDGIGIHGTHDSKSIGTKASEGCIRLKNEDVSELKEIIYSSNKGIGTRVIISED